MASVTSQLAIRNPAKAARRLIIGRIYAIGFFARTRPNRPANRRSPGRFRLLGKPEGLLPGSPALGGARHVGDVVAQSSTSILMPPRPGFGDDSRARSLASLARADAQASTIAEDVARSRSQRGREQGEGCDHRHRRCAARQVPAPRASSSRRASRASAFCNVVFGWDAADVCYDNARYTGWHTGYPDALVRLDPAHVPRSPLGLEGACSCSASSSRGTKLSHHSPSARASYCAA